jgi:peptidoglycan/LPS O-acetylase OafA/YrhL
MKVHLPLVDRYFWNLFRAFKWWVETFIHPKRLGLPRYLLAILCLIFGCVAIMTTYPDSVNTRFTSTEVGMSVGGAAFVAIFFLLAFRAEISAALVALGALAIYIMWPVPKYQPHVLQASKTLAVPLGLLAFVTSVLATVRNLQRRARNKQGVADPESP